MNDILKKMGSFSIGPIVSALFGFILIPVITYFISPAENGRASMFSLAVSILQMVMYLGLDQAYIKKYYEIDSKEKLLANVMFPPLLLVILLELIIFLLRGRISLMLFDSESETGCVLALMLMPPSLVAEQFALTEVRMKQKGGEYSLLTATIKLLILIVTVLLLALREKSFRSVIWGTALAQVIFAMFLLLTRRVRILLSPAYLDRELMHSLLRYGLPLIPAAIIGWVLHGMDRVMLRTLSDYTSLGIYDVAMKVSNILAVAQSCFASFWVPLAHQWNNDGGDVERFNTVGKYVCLVMSFIFLGVLLFKDVIFLIFKSTYSEAAYILPFLLVYPIMYTASEVPVMGIYFKEKTKSTLVVSCVSAAVNLLLNRLLIPVLGAEGAALATGVSYIVFFWCRALLSRKVWYRFPLKGYIFTSVLILAAAAANTLIRSWLIYPLNFTFLVILFLFYKEEIKIGLTTLKSFLLGKKT